MAHDHDHKLEPPKDFEVPSVFRNVCLVLVVVGVVAFAISAASNPHAAWNGYLIGFWFTLSLALIGPFIVATQHLTIAGWSTSVRRIPLAYGSFVLPAFVLAVIGILGGGHLFEWYDTELVRADHILAKKEGFYNQTSFAIWTGISFIGWIVTIFLMKKRTLQQDEDGKYEHTYALQKISALFVLSFIVGFSLMSWFWIMGLQPHWFSTMFSVYCFAGAFQAGWALTILITLWLNDRGYLGGFFGTEQIHQLGKMLFAFTVFYAYIGFSQFLLIWYANIPEEAIWYVTRGMTPIETGWGNVSLLIPFAKFIVPFFILLPQAIKKNKGNVLRWVAGWLLLMQLFETWYWVAPTPGHGTEGYAAALHFPFVELAIVGAFLGMFGFVVSRELAKAPIMPLKDPFLHEAVPHHNHGTKPPQPAEIVIS